MSSTEVQTEGTTGAAEQERVHLVLITGLSGAGKSTVANGLEDLGYHVVDNLPLSLLTEFLRRPEEHIPDVSRIAVVTDLRTPGFDRQLPQLLEQLDRDRIEPFLLFLETSNEILIRRYSETRRRHPLARDGLVIDGVRREREILGELRSLADRVIDTGAYTVHEIRAEIHREFSARSLQYPTTIHLISFGFKRGIPYGSDLVFDIRFLPNPHFQPELRTLTGKHDAVRDYLENIEDFRELSSRLEELLAFLLPRYAEEHRSYLTIALGCTGGQHRSVALVERLGDRLQRLKWRVRLSHRDLPLQVAATQ